MIDTRRFIMMAVGLVAAALVAFWVMFSSKSAPDSGEPTAEDLRLELLTILGDVANRPRDLAGRWRTARDGGLDIASGEEAAELTGIMTLPYLQGYKEAPSEDNVTRYDEDRAFDGVNLYTSGHAPEAFLMDMSGKVLHRWRMDIDDVWPEVPRTIHSTFWRRVYSYPNGDLLAIFEGIGMIKLDRFSRLQWTYRGACHHEAFVTEDGNIYVLTRRAGLNPRVNPVRPVLQDAVSILSPQGKLIDEYALFECLYNSPYRQLMEGMRAQGDIFHTNSLYVFDGSKSDLSPHFKKGNVLLSFLKLDAIAIVDLEKETVVWAKSGRPGNLWKKQHDPVLLDNGHLLLFDNRGHNGTSKVVEFDPGDMRVVWQYSGEEGDTLLSMTCGTSDRLPNGNTLITESDNGRALEVTRDGAVVWEFYNPHRAGEDNTLIATLFELRRFDKEYFSWLQLE